PKVIFPRSFPEFGEGRAVKMQEKCGKTLPGHSGVILAPPVKVLPGPGRFACAWFALSRMKEVRPLGNAESIGEEELMELHGSHGRHGLIWVFRDYRALPCPSVTSARGKFLRFLRRRERFVSELFV